MRRSRRARTYVVPSWLSTRQCAAILVHTEAKLLEQVVARLLQQGYSNQPSTSVAMQQLAAQLTASMAGRAPIPTPQQPDALAAIMQTLSQPAPSNMYQQGATSTQSLNQLLQAASGLQSRPETWPGTWPNGYAVMQQHGPLAGVPAPDSASPVDTRKASRR